MAKKKKRMGLMSPKQKRNNMYALIGIVAAAGLAAVIIHKHRTGSVVVDPLDPGEFLTDEQYAAQYGTDAIQDGEVLSIATGEPGSGGGRPDILPERIGPFAVDYGSAVSGKRSRSRGIKGIGNKNYC